MNEDSLPTEKSIQREDLIGLTKRIKLSFRPRPVVIEGTIIDAVEHTDRFDYKLNSIKVIKGECDPVTLTQWYLIPKTKHSHQNI